MVSRVIVHPKYRSIGLGEKLVRDTLPFAGTPCVEAVAVMARYNPFFEKAGMQKIAESQPTRAVADAITKLETLGFDAALLASAAANQRQLQQTGTQPIQAILVELSQKDSIIRRRIAKTENPYPRHQEFQEKTAQFSHAELAEALKRLSFANQTKTYLFWQKETIAMDRCGSTPRLRLNPLSSTLIPAPP